MAAGYGAMQAVAGLELPLHVVGLVSAAENMPSKPCESHGGTGVGVRLLAAHRRFELAN